jgi:hypothetical protein
MDRLELLTTRHVLAMFRQAYCGLREERVAATFYGSFLSSLFSF